ncbi:MAG: NAD(P)/FAD-dependent oxidoreductase [Defluviitaleaceae bacterium]|nr:NAD(P)/FAD-dependent oxidoreductase [Defluviitaleaceae bacterium]
MQNTKTIVVIGGGPSGMMAASTAARENTNSRVILIEKNSILAKKMSITGGGRCNITNICDTETLIKKIQRNPKFLYSSLYTFTSEMIIDILKNTGLDIKVEDNGRVFPVSNNSKDVIGSFKQYLNLKNIDILLNTNVKDILKTTDNKFIIKIENEKINKEIKSDCVIISTGGLSAKVTGSTGDGYRFAKKLGHSLTENFYPSVVPLKIKEKFTSDLQGISFKNVYVKMFLDNKKIFEDNGDIIFTHFGVSGPVILRASAHIAKKLNTTPKIYIDFFPNEKSFDIFLLDIFKNNINKNLKTVLEGITTQRLVEVMFIKEKVDLNLKIRDITKETRLTVVNFFKNLELTVVDTMGFNPAIATAGGVLVKEVNPSNMESKIVNGLYFTGEVLDVDAYTGGYNLQIAFSTGYVAGLSAARSIL